LLALLLLLLLRCCCLLVSLPMLQGARVIVLPAPIDEDAKA